MAKFSVNGANAADKAHVINYMASLGDKEYTIEIKATSKKRSLAENNYYFGVVVKMLADHLGYFQDEMHEILKMQFDAKSDILPNGKMVIYAGTTTDYSVAEFEERLEKIRIWALTEFRLSIPMPHEHVEDKEEAI